MNTATPNSPPLVLILLIIIPAYNYAQQITGWQTSYQPDNSYYDIEKVGPNEFWAAGEGGTLYSIDSSGNISEISFPDKEANILKILPVEEYIYLAADKGKLFQYNRNTQDFRTRYFGKKFDQLCFYDMIQLEDGTLLVVGGHNKIAKGEKTIPLGFIARISPALDKEPEIVWNNPFTFVWSVTRVPGSDEIVAASFNGLNTNLFSSVDGANTFQKSTRIQGLVHHLQPWNGELWYSGTKDIRFSKQGIMGKVGSRDRQVSEGGCIWSLFMLGDQMAGLSYSGEILLTDSHNQHTTAVKATDFSLYEGVNLTPDKALVIGHGRRLYMINMENQAITYTPSADLSQAAE